MSQRSRHARGSNRNNVSNHVGEELGFWLSAKDKLVECVNDINEENDNLNDILKMDKKLGAMDGDDITNDMMKQLEELCRSGVKYSDNNISNLKEVIERLKVVRAVVADKEQADVPPTVPNKRVSTRDSTAASSLYDFDATGDSPVPSPIGGPARKYGERSSNRDRDSMPPKADSAEPQGPSVGGSSAASASGAASAANKFKVVFQKGDTVAFKPKSSNGDPASDWILGEVAQVLGEGKSRRYKVLDVEPEDQSKQKEYRSSASSMIPIPPESQAASLRESEPGQVVLALYPNTTTFYKAEVDSTAEDGRVNLKFEGENDSSTLQQVERRFVIEYRA